MRHVAALALAVGLAAAALCQPALAQRPEVPRDSVRADSVPPDSVPMDTMPADSVRRPIHPWWGPLLIPATVAVGVVLAVAPAPLARWWGGPRRNDMAFVRDHGAVYASVGGRFEKGETWANAVSVQMVRRGAYAELQGEDFWRPRHVRYLTARGGRLWHPRRSAAGGVTLGYVHVDGDPAQRGPELGLPLFLGDRTVTGRFEPTYVASPDGPLWSYRLQLEGYPRGGRYVVGAAVTGKSNPLTPDSRGGVAARAVTVLLGTRF
jgi:hypothetical protein